MPHEDPFALSDALIDAIAALSPMSSTAWGIPGKDDRWDDLSPEGHEQMRACLAGFLERVPPVHSGMDRWTRLATAVLDDYLCGELDRYAHGDPLADLNHIASPFQSFRMSFQSMDLPEMGEATVARVERLPEALDGYRRSLDLGLHRGLAVAARQVRAVAEQGRVWASERCFLHTFADKVDPSLHPRLAKAVPRATAAYGQFSDWLETGYLPSARQTDAVGRARYAREARRFLGMDIDLDDTYAWGWRELVSIGEQMRAVCTTIAPGRSVPEVLDLMRSDPARSEAPVERFLDTMRARQTQALERLSGTHFEVPEAIRALDVKRTPVGGPIGVYYAGPSEDFRRPGCVWYSLGDATSVPVYDHISTAYHEGFPGHHLQVGIQVGLAAQLSRLHRIGYGYSGYAEGWALYAEQLMDELGYYEIPDYQLGYLAGQLIRAARVVIDIGSHLELPIPSDQPFHPGEAWSFETGVEMLRTLGGLAADRAASEMTRYLGWPGQAISYKVGQRVMLDLRAEMQRRQGQAFDLKAFHATVLGYGNVGLAELRSLVLAS